MRSPLNRGGLTAPYQLDAVAPRAPLAALPMSASVTEPKEKNGESFKMQIPPTFLNLSPFFSVLKFLLCLPPVPVPPAAAQD
jgi:hypothetical protein